MSNRVSFPMNMLDCADKKEAMRILQSARTKPREKCIVGISVLMAVTILAKSDSIITLLKDNCCAHCKAFCKLHALAISATDTSCPLHDNAASTSLEQAQAITPIPDVRCCKDSAPSMLILT
ncbi:hypothetical protein SLA2020_204110 [Shorea laevis]